MLTKFKEIYKLTTSDELKKGIINFKKLEESIISSLKKHVIIQQQQPAQQHDTLQTQQKNNNNDQESRNEVQIVNEETIPASTRFCFFLLFS